MTLREINLPVVDGYQSPVESDDENESDCTLNVLCEIHGYSEQLGLAFITHRRCKGNNLRNIVEKAYSLVFNRFRNKYNISVNELYIEQIYRLDSDNRRNFSGNAFYPLDDEVRNEFKEHEERSFMSNEDINVDQ